MSGKGNVREKSVGRRRSLLALSVATAVAMAIRPHQASADTLYWDGAGVGDSSLPGAVAGGSDSTGTWVDGSGYRWYSYTATDDVNWNSATPDSAVFGANANDTGIYVVTLGSNITANGITFRPGPTYNIAGGGFSLTLNGGGINVLSGVATPQNILAPTILGADQTWTNSGTSTLTMSGAMSGTGNLTTNGAVNLSTGTSSFTGNITVASGRLTATAAGSSTTFNGSLGAVNVATRTITVASGATLAFTTNNIFGSGYFTYTRPTIVLNGGTLTANNFNALGNLVMNGALVTSTSAGASTGYSTFQLGSLVTVGGSSASTFNFSAGSGGLNLAPSTEFAVSPTGATGGDLVVAESLFNRNSDSGGAGSLLKSGTGTMLLGGTSTYTGTTNIAGGRLILGTTGSTVGSITATTGLNLGVNASSGILQIGDAGNPATVTTTSLSVAGTGTANAIVGGNSANSTLTVNAAAASTFTGNLGGTDTNANNLSLTKNGTATLTLSGSNTYVGPTLVNAGTLAFGTSGTMGGASALTLNAANLSVTGTQTLGFNGLTVGSNGASNVSNTGTINFGAISRSVGGGSLDFAASGTNTTTTANTNGLLGAWATYGGHTSFATVGAGGVISGISSYTKTSVAGTTSGNYAGGNIDVDNSAGTLSAGISPNSFRFNTAAATTVTLASGSTNVLASAGILVTPTVGASASTITGGTLTAPGGAELIVQQFGTGALTIGSVLADNGTPISLTKMGTGTLNLNAANTFTGGIVATSTGLSTNNNSGLGTGPLTVRLATSAGTVASGNASFLSVDATSAAVTLANNIVLPAPTSTSVFTFQKVATTNVVDLAGVISGGNSSTMLELNTTSSGDSTSPYRLDGSNTFTGGVTVNRGVLVLGNVAALGAATNILTLNSNAGTTPGLTIAVSGTIPNPIVMSLTGPIDIGANTVTLSGILSGSNTFTKVGAGTLTLSGANTFTGNVNISAGTVSIPLRSDVTTAGALGVPSTAGRTITVGSNATLALTTNNVFSGGAFNATTGAYVNARPALIVAGTVTSNGFNAVGDVTLNGGSLTSTATGSSGYGAFGLSSNVSIGGTAVSSIGGVAGTYVNLSATTTFTVADATASSATDLAITANLVNRNSDGGGGAASIVKNGLGTMSLSGADTFSGTTTVNAGTILASTPNGGNGAFGSSAGITINNGGTIAATNDNAYLGGGVNVPTTINAGGTLTNTGDVSAHLGGLVTLNGGTLATAGSYSNYYGAWNIDRGLAVTANSTVSAIGVTLSQTGGTQISVTPGATLNVTGTLTKTGGASDTALSLVGGGTVVLSGTNTYAAGTTIVGGTVVRANNATSSLGVGAVTVGDGVNASSGVLAGTGAVGNGTNPLAVRLGGTITGGTGITPSDTVGNLSTGALAWNTSGTFVAKYNATNTTDRLIMSNLSYAGGGFTVNIVTTTGATIVPNNYVIAVDKGFAYTPGADPFLTSSLTLNINGSLANPALYFLSEGADTTTLGGTDLILTATPEPTSLLLLGAIASPALLGRRRVRRR